MISAITMRARTSDTSVTAVGAQWVALPLSFARLIGRCVSKTKPARSRSKSHRSRAGASSQLDLDRGIVLVGLMGAGKTTVGRRLATRLNLDFLDADDEITKAAGLSVSDIFETMGEAAFRDGERKVIARLLDGTPCVLATGGGAFMDDETRALIKTKATSIWLRADLDVLMKRVSRRDTRPLLRTPDPRKVMSELLAKRGPIYAQADITVDSGDGPHASTVDAIIEALAKYAQNDET